MTVYSSSLQVIQIYKDPDGNPLKRGNRASGLSRGTPYSQSIEALQNRARIDQAEKEAEEAKSTLPMRTEEDGCANALGKIEAPETRANADQGEY